ncbi:hypothetical protein D8674_032985 [Pyrus ussuriensis x Pyrus communis]|uniref:FHA domain-containing protein n=1 Tax=Pyrus ussuriensis x Pyrus communis TaxID=2448454 RepID=A0A5N5HRP3_9ROSA|nr:hypothetical protein D8674_032985 [Pyrus ussuriensis x Pyrus communis]
MGALAPFSKWIPADDILLKKAVEDGASLESLAKGAVHFSRRFTVRELQDRWYSLLYDPVVSEDASARMIEFESSTTTVPFDRSGNSKEKKCESGKRKAESVRSSYYAMRKRICNEPFNSMGLNFLVAPSNNNYHGNGDEPLYGNCMNGDPTSAPFGLETSDVDAMQNLMNVGIDDTFHMLQNPDGNDFHMEQGNIHEDIMTWNESEVDEFNHPEGLPDCSLFNADDLGMKFTLDQINGNEGNMCTEFEGNKAFNSPVSDSGALFNNLEYSCPLPAMPVDVDLRENNMCTSDAFELHENIDADSARTSETEVHIRIEVDAEMPCGDFQSSAAPVSTEGYLAELSNSLLNFTNEELMLMTADGKDVIDKSYYDGLSSLLLRSPKDGVHQEQTIVKSEPETSVAPVMDSMNPPSTYPGVVDDNRGSPNADEDMVCHSETPMLSSSTASNYQNPELKDGVICCPLNTEDPEIPCNDDIFLPNRPSTSEVDKPLSLSTRGFPVNKRNNDTGSCFMHRERKNLGEPHSTSQIKGSHFLQEKGLKPPLGNFGVKFELSKTDASEVASKNAGHVSEVLGQIYSANPSTSVQPGILKEDTREKSISAKLLNYNSTEFHVEKPDSGVIKQELDPSATIRDNKSLHTGGIAEAQLNPETSDQLGIFESDDDVPCYSDIEAMVLDMDLDPYDQELYSSEEVSKYQNEDAKRTIIRLEQCAYSYLQRATASHGAFAILYGRHSKHYIQKPEVLLGRATDDAVVDIDLGSEGRGNKISRKQAMINMDKDGSFHLKNLGKCSISVNSKEVAPGQSLSLSSSCLIEIRGMPFIFEMNQTRVKQYLDSIPQ